MFFARLLYVALSVTAQNDVMDNSFFELDCDNQQFKITFNKSQIDDVIPSIQTDFQQSIFVSSFDGSLSQDTENCKPTNDTVGEYVIEFMFTECDQNSREATVTDNNITYVNYIIHHRHLGNGVYISSMSPHKVTCTRDSRISIEGDSTITHNNKTVEENAVVPKMDDYVSLMIASGGDAIVTPMVGDKATMTLVVNSLFDTFFKYRMKTCVAKSEKDQRVVLIDNFCSDQLITDMDTAGQNYGGDFRSFDFTLFRFQDEQKMTFECTIEMYDTFDEPDSYDCPLWAAKKDNSLRRRRTAEVSTVNEVSISTSLSFTEQPEEIRNVVYGAMNNDSGVQLFTYNLFLLVLSIFSLQ